jgi:hypothetical protein
MAGVLEGFSLLRMIARASGRMGRYRKIGFHNVNPRRAFFLLMFAVFWTNALAVIAIHRHSTTG